MSFTDYCVFSCPHVLILSLFKVPWFGKGCETDPCWYHFMTRCAVVTLILKFWYEFTGYYENKTQAQTSYSTIYNHYKDEMWNDIYRNRPTLICIFCEKYAIHINTLCGRISTFVILLICLPVKNDGLANWGE
jgi:hypothetical protein